MLRIRKILFPTDFSASADEALSYALFLAGAYGAELHLLHVHVLHEEDPFLSDHAFPDREELMTRIRAAAAERMSAAVQQRDVGETVIKHVQQRDISAAPAIVAYAVDEEIDVIVMGTHGRRGVRHLLLGSVTEEVVRLAPCAVLTVRTPATTPHPLSALRHVLAPVDFSDDSREALRVARHLAANTGARLHVLHVLEEVVQPGFYRFGDGSIRDLHPDIENRTMEAMRALVAETGGPAAGPGGEIDYHAREGKAAAEIDQFAGENSIDLIVIATHGLTGLDHFFIGSVSEKVIRRAPCPVLVVKRSRSLVDG